MKLILLVFLGSGCGGALRFLVSKYLKFSIMGSFPLATFTVNVLGCFLIGLFSGLFNNSSISNEAKTFLTVGFCGGFTTFSTFTNENFLLAKGGDMMMGIVYVVASLIVGLLALWAGYKVSGN